MYREYVTHGIIRVFDSNYIYHTVVHIVCVWWGVLTNNSEFDLENYFLSINMKQQEIKRNWRKFVLKSYIFLYWLYLRKKTYFIITMNSESENLQLNTKIWCTCIIRYPTVNYGHPSIGLSQTSDCENGYWKWTNCVVSSSLNQ